MRRTFLLFILCMCLLLGGCGKSHEASADPAIIDLPTEDVATDEAEENGALFGDNLGEFDPEELNAATGLTLSDLLLTNAQTFSDGLAWVQYADEAGNTVTSVVDTEGKIRFSLPQGVEPSYMGQFMDGYAYYRVGKNYDYKTSYEVIVDENGTECYRTENSDSAKSWEHVFGYENGGFICYLEATGLESVTYTVALIQANGELINSYSCGSWALFGEYPHTEFDDVRYYGDGWYGMAGYYLNFDKQLIVQRDHAGLLRQQFIDGKIPSIRSSWISILDENLEVIENLSIDGVTLNKLDSCIICGDNMGANLTYRKAAYYDYWGNQFCEVTVYPDRGKKSYEFYGDYALLLIRGADWDIYVTAINKQGEMQFEPYDLVVNGNSSEEYVKTEIYDNYIILQDTTGDYVLMDMSGNIVHSIANDFPDCEIRDIGEYGEGYIIISYAVDGMIYQKHYPVAEAAAAGDSVYNIGRLSPSTVATGTGMSAEFASLLEEMGYVHISGLSIEGKWKSVGYFGFGQAQPGATVFFDGTNCNFFSPQDTYAFYEDGDEYRLDVTSFLFSDTLSFTVKILDENHFDIISGEKITELERIE